MWDMIQDNVKNSALKECPPGKRPLCLSDIIRLVMQQMRHDCRFSQKRMVVKKPLAIIKELKAEPWLDFNDEVYLKWKEVKNEVNSMPVFLGSSLA